ncbi:ribose 5-phosphate isomerase B [Candidatus Peregrinibacteria bacterium]|nr:ribose 5-phosphate isomerase B [Candidatus Peregrinibacteria bacterium]
MKKVVIGSDHAGFALKEVIKRAFGETFEFIDVGTDSEASVDYPVYAEKVGRAVAKDSDALGILVCGSGIGMSIAANKIRGIRAALAYSQNAARLSREHNHANVLVLPGREATMDTPLDIVRAFLDTIFSEEERHARRVREIKKLEK